ARAASGWLERGRADFPPPDGPMMQITSPVITSIETPLSTSTPPPNALCTSARRTSGWSGVQGINPLRAHSRESGHPGPHATTELGPRFCGDERTASCSRSTSFHREALFQRERRARDRIAIEEEPQQQVKIH